jgi:hypothetical protein
MDTEGGLDMSNGEFVPIPETLLVQLPDGKIEEIALDEYLKSVVPTEMGLKKPTEALKAQAIASRSYAVTTRRHARDGFDMCCTTHCQVYKPKNRYEDSDCAVDETYGQILTYSGRLVGAPFFGHCDGHTRNSEDVWPNRVEYLRSVSCICGYTSLYGHGVGMCQRGAAAMATQGAPAVEILKHYYTGVEIAQATPIPRTGFRRSMILGRVVDVQGKPRSDLRLVLHGPEGPTSKGTTSDGRFYFIRLPVGQWELRVKGKPIRYRNLVTDGRNTVELQVVVSDIPTLSVNTMPLAHPNQLIGTLGIDGIEVAITDGIGEVQRVLSGSAPEFNPGGFAAALPVTDAFTVQVLDQRFELETRDAGLWLRFTAQTE